MLLHGKRTPLMASVVVSGTLSRRSSVHAEELGEVDDHGELSELIHSGNCGGAEVQLCRGAEVQPHPYLEKPRPADSEASHTDSAPACTLSASKCSAGPLFPLCGSLLQQVLGWFLFKVFPRVLCFAHVGLPRSGGGTAHRRIAVDCVRGLIPRTVLVDALNSLCPDNLYVTGRCCASCLCWPLPNCMTRQRQPMEILLIDIGALAMFLGYIAIVYWHGVSHQARTVRRRFPSTIAPKVSSDAGRGS